MGIIFKAPALILYVVAGLWGLLITFEIAQRLMGTILALISLIFAPFLLALAPWYDALVNGEWFALVLIYGGGITAFVLYAIGAAIDGE